MASSTAGARAPTRAGADVRPGFEILRAAVPYAAVDGALRRIHQDVLRQGLPSEDVGLWIRTAHWFPHVKWEPEITALADALPEELRSGEMCDPQIVLQLPDVDEDVELVSHVDAEPEWAQERRYLRIVGIALSPSRASNGGLVAWPLDGGEPEPVELEPGDAVIMDPALPHTSGLNREGTIRYAVYFRFLGA